MSLSSRSQTEKDEGRSPGLVTSALKPVVAGVSVIAILLLGSILFIVTRPSIPAITVRNVKSDRSGDWVAATFEIANHTTSSYYFYPLSVEARTGQAWEKCFGFNSLPYVIISPHAHGPESFTFNTTNLPTGSLLRLRLCAGRLVYKKRFVGLKELFQRFELRFRHGKSQVSLNPFDKRMKVLSKPTEIVSDEFGEPEPNQSGQANSDK